MLASCQKVTFKSIKNTLQFCFLEAEAIWPLFTIIAIIVSKIIFIQCCKLTDRHTFPLPKSFLLINSCFSTAQELGSRPLKKKIEHGKIIHAFQCFLQTERKRERGHLAGRKWETVTSIGETSLNEAVKLSDGNGFKREQ